MLVSHGSGIDSSILDSTSVLTSSKTSIDIEKIRRHLEPLGLQNSSPPVERALLKVFAISLEYPVLPAMFFLVMLQSAQMMVYMAAGNAWETYFHRDPIYYLTWVVEFFLPLMVFIGVSSLYRKTSEDLNIKIVEGLARGAEIQKVSILGFAKISEVRDPETGDHIIRMGHFSKELAKQAGELPKYCKYVTRTYCEDIFISAPLHDIGKVGIRDNILKKTDALTADEFEIMKMHTIIGGDLLHELELKLGYRTFYSLSKEIAYHHHQRYDGTGYPNVFGNSKAMFVEPGIGRALHGEQIPLSARIVAIADVYDALISRRCYKEALPHEKAKAMMLEQSGKHFDPELLSVFFNMEDRLHGIQREFHR